MAVLATAAVAAGTSGTALRTGTATLQAGPQGSDTIPRGQVELPPGARAEEDEGGDSEDAARPSTRLNNHPFNRAPFSRSRLAGARDPGPAVAATRAGSQPQLLTDWHGLDHRATRLADGGNQFSGEPPDQGLCVGGGFVFESVNQAVRVYDTNGAPLSGVVSLNDFYGFPPAIDRTTLTFPGPFIFDPECHFDPASQRWFHVAAMIEQDEETGAFTGFNALLLAVSQSANPLGIWNVYEIPATNNGDFGTPDHECGPEPGDPCFGDFPHLGVDAHGVYITTNEFSFFGDGFFGAQIYAFAKDALASGADSVPFVLINTSDFPVHRGQPGFTAWPAKSAGTEFEHAARGTEYFLSSNAVFDDVHGISNELIVWALTNTNSLNSPTPSLDLHHTIVNVTPYAVPSPANQKPGPIPLAECINDTVLPTPFGRGCWQMLFVDEPEHDETLGPIDSGDSRITDVRFADGRLWGVLSTQVRFAGTGQFGGRTGVAWYILDPEVSRAGVLASLHLQGVLADRTANFTYPTLGITTSGRGILGFSFMSERYHPSAGYAPIDDRVGAGDWSEYELGLSPQDGFTEYKAFGELTPRWGDYSAAAVDGNTVYVATEYIGVPPCTLTGVAPYNGAPPWYYPFPSREIPPALRGFGSCLVENPIPSQARTSLANWGTRIGKFNPS
jgi:hypothetical protein